MVVRHPHRVSIGDNVIIDDNVLLDARGSKGRGIVIGDGVVIGRNTMLSMKEGTINIGPNVNISINCALQTSTRIEVGASTIIAPYTNIVAGGNHRFDDPKRPIITQGMVCKGGIVIEDDVWLGARVTVLDGVRIGRGSVIGACSMVNEDIPPMSVAYGVPAKVARSRDRGE